MSSHDVGSWGLLILSICLVWFMIVMSIGVGALVRMLRDSTKPFPWHVAGHPHPAAPEHLHSPEHIVAQRFARGDIDAETYTRSIALLRDK
jgi:putative membrane protein